MNVKIETKKKMKQKCVIEKMSYATCEICDTHVEEFIKRTPGNAEMKCPSCNMWVYGFYTLGVSKPKTENVKHATDKKSARPLASMIETKRDAKNKYNERIRVIIKNKVDYYNKKK